MSTNKVWLHTGAPCHGCTGIGDHWRALHQAGVPFAVYSVEGAGLIVEASAYPGATLVYRTLATDVAAYDLSPVDAAGRAWSILMDRLPPEIKALKGRVWVEVGNEQDKTRADWLGHYYAELAGYVLANGYRQCAGGWSTGEPEPADWATPGWLGYLRLCAEYPDRLAVSVHEYSLDADDIMNGFPWLVGRVHFLFETCKANGIAPPTVFVTEVGWTHNDLPQADKAREDINALARLYAGYPSVKAAFLWSVMGGGDKRTLAAELNALLPWLTEYAVTTRLPDVDDGPVEPPPPVPGPVKVLDISKWQGTIHPARMKAAGVDGVMLRAGYSTSSISYRDERLDVFAPALEAEGIPYGLYWYFHPARPVAEQFAAFRAAVNQHGYQLRLALDLEEMAGVDSATAAKAGEFAALMAKEYPLPAGKKHLIYTSLGYWRDRLGSPAWGANFDLWIAAWTEAAAPLVPVPWSTWALWQYTSDGDGPAHGVGSARVDLNRFNGDAAGFAAWQATEQPPPFEAALWGDSLNKRTEWGWNTGAALAKAILGGRLSAADGMIPTGYEIRFEHGGKVWYYQIAHSGDRQTRRVYYVEKDKWSVVRFIDGPGAPVVPPPVETTVDLLPYFQGTHRRQFDMGHNVDGGGTQTVQVWHLGPSDWLYVKGEAGEYERLGLRTWNGAEWIFRFEDTSESPDRFYAHYMTAGGAIGAPWLPRRAVVGRWYETPKFVQHYRKGDCAKQDGGPVTDKLRLVAGPRPVTYPESGATLPDVITVEWDGGEQYDFAVGRGCVAFRDARRRFWFIGDLQGRPDRTYRKPGCINLGW